MPTDDRGFVLLGPLGGSAGRRGNQACSSYPAPGGLAPADTKVPAALAARDSVSPNT